jgi:hypothetical protein
MTPVTEKQQSEDANALRRMRARAIGERYEVSERTGGEWLRAMVAAGVLRKVRAITVGTWAAVDGWLANGGQVPQRRRGGSRP